MQYKRFFVSGIGTDVGKTLISAILTEALHADYWKPVQSGDLDHSDTDKVRALISNTDTKFFPEAYRLQTPVSPHASARIDHIEIRMEHIKAPENNNHLIIEGAGGLMVPLNDRALIIDLAARLGVPLILVSRNYLGSINHTLLSTEILTRRKIPVKGIIFNGPENRESETFIERYSGLPVLGHVEEAKKTDKEFVLRMAEQFRFLAVEEK